MENIEIDGSILSTQKFCLSVTLKDKKYNQHRETAAIIETLKIDQKEIIPRYCHRTVYRNDHDSEVITNYLGYNGEWQLFIVEPFYRWLHKVEAKGMLIGQSIL
jgi:adenylate kinase family enzyme